jgi:localization factor PodJL
MSLGDWLDEVVAEQAADQGISVDDLDEDDKLDAIGDRLSRLSRHPKRSGEEARRALDSLEAAADYRDDLDDPIGDRLSRLSRHERAPVAARRDAGEDKRIPRPERKRPGEEARRTRDLLETAEDERDDDKLDAIADRLSRLSSRDRAMAANLPNAGNDAPDPLPERIPSAEEARREQELLEAAVAKFETRAAKSEERTAKAFESVATWIEQSQADRAQERATLRSVAQKLTDIEQRSVREVERPPVGPSRAASYGEDAAADIDKRLSALARRVAAPQRARGEYRRRDERPRIDVRDSVVQIARRQTELDSQEISGRQSATTRGVPRDFGADPGLRSSEPQVRPTVKHSPADGVNVTSTEETLRKEIAALTARVARLRAADVEQTSSPTVAEDLRAGLAAMSRSLAALAPRNASVALEGAVGDFGQRLDAARKAGASDRLVAPVESMLDQVRETLRDHDPRIAAAALEREIRALGDKVEALARMTVSPEVFERLRSQTEEVRSLLAEAALRPVPVERLERQIGELADRVERLATSPTPHADTARVVEALSEARSQIERSTPAAALNSIERRVEQLAARMDEALRRTPTIDPGPLEDLARRIDGVRFSVERQAEQRPDAAKLEAVLLDISSKLDRPLAAGADSKALTSTLQELTARLEEAFRRSSSSTNFDPTRIEDLARRIEAVRATMERQGDFRPHAAKLEAALSDINSKLDRPTAAGADSKALTSTLQELTARLEEAFRRPAPSTNFDPRPLEDLARRIESVRTTVERQADFRPHAAKLEAALTDINSKLDRPPAAGGADSKALTSTLQELTARLEEAFRRSSSSANFDPRPIEDLATRIEAVRATMERQGDFRPHAAKLEAALSDINSKLDRPPVDGRDTKALMVTLQDQMARLEEAFRRPVPSVFDPRPIEELARRIENVRVTVERHADFRPHAAKLEAALSDINSKLDRPPAASTDTKVLTSTLQDMTARLDKAFRRPATAVKFDPEPLEDLARQIDGLRVTIERTTDFLPDAEKLDAALANISAKLDGQAFSPDDVHALTGALQDLASRIDQGSNPIVDTAPIERILRSFGERPVEIDTAPIEEMLRDLGEKFAASIAPVAIDTSPIERMLSRVDATLDAVARLPTDVRPLEHAVRELHEKLDFRDAPQIDVRVIEQAADLLAKRLDLREGSALDTEALVNQISEIHGRIDSLNSTAESAAALERTVAELLDELEATRKTLQSPAMAPSSAAAMIGDIAELRAEQKNSDRRMQARLADVQDILERLVSRLGRIEDEVGRAEEDGLEPERSAPTFATRPTMKEARVSEEASDAALRSIPDRIPRPSAREGVGGTPRGAGANSPDGEDFLLEPGRPPPRMSDAESDSLSPARNVGINAHIAAARRAAQAALLDSAAKTEGASTSRSQGTKAGPVSSPLQQAQEFFAARRRPVLLGVAFLAIVTTLAVVGLRGGSRPQTLQKSELPAPVQSPAPLASAPRAGGASNTAAAVDSSPVGSLTPARTPLASALRPAPADLVAAIPVGVAAALREAANAGDPGAETELGIRYLEGRTLPRDPKMAARWFEQAAVQGLPIAQYRLAALYEKGTGVTSDVPLARAWYLKAANAGNARAMHNLAVMYAEDGGTGKPDYAEAAHWFRRAGELGVRDSQFNLGVLYGRGLGVPQDLEQSWLWFSLASRQGDADAAKKRDEVAAKLDSKGLAAATKALTEFKEKAPEPSANEARAPVGGWDARTDAPQSGRQSALSVGGTVSLNARG